MMGWYEAVAPAAESGAAPRTGHPQIMESMRVFGEQIAPRFR
jgi:hypothetical protein